MNQQVQKYPKRADTLALLKARERNAAPRQGVAARPQDAVLCLGFCAPR
jgi:hypothetical protein